MQLIGLATSHMNLIHLKNGTLGSTGHVVAIEQNLSEIALMLPRLPSSINIIKLIRKGITKDQDVYQRMFKVRRLVVLTALKWLCRYNYNYRQLKIIICEKNLDWMDGKDEALLPVNNSIDTSVIHYELIYCKFK